MTIIRAEGAAIVAEIHVAAGEIVVAASLLEFDAVIDPAATRDEIDRALLAAGPGIPGPRYVDAW
jgi:hypothetical protein